MLLQTFLQLHILLAATPALAGWGVFVPTSQPLSAHVLYLVSQNAVRPHAAVSAGTQVVVRHASGAVRRSAVTVPPTASVVSALRPSTTETLPQNDFNDAHSPRAP